MQSHEKEQKGNARVRTWVGSLPEMEIAKGSPVVDGEDCRALEEPEKDGRGGGRDQSYLGSGTVHFGSEKSSGLLRGTMRLPAAARFYPGSWPRDFGKLGAGNQRSPAGKAAN